MIDNWTVYDLRFFTHKGYDYFVWIYNGINCPIFQIVNNLSNCHLSNRQ